MNNEERPLVSVIVGCYNHQDYVAEAIDSVMNQTYKDFELIITDDGSSDLSREVIKERIDFWNNDSRIVFLESEINTSFAILDKAYNISKGKYICGIGGDDFIDPGRIEKQVNVLENEGKYKACFTWVECVGEDENKKDFFSRLFNRRFDSSEAILKHLLLVGNCLCAPSFMMNREKYFECGGYNFSFVQLQDYRLWLKYLLKNEIYIIPEKLTFYRVVGGSLSDSNNLEVNIRSMTEHEEILFDIFREIEEPVFDLLFPDKEEDHHTIIDLMCREIKMLLGYCSQNIILGNVALKLYYEYLGENGFYELLSGRYGIDRMSMRRLITEKSIYGLYVKTQNQLAIYKYLNEKQRFDTENVNKPDETMVEELLDFVDFGEGNVSLDHIISLYNFCKNNDKNDFLGLLIEMNEKGIELIN